MGVLAGKQKASRLDKVVEPSVVALVQMEKMER
jgi:hypothetical protein